MTPLATPTCPLCGGPNACRPAQSGSFDGPCWCQSAAFEPALARVPPALQRTACICARCAGAATVAPPGIADAA